MDKNLTKNAKRIVLEVPEHIHHAVKASSAFKNQTMRDYILLLIAQQLAKEKDYMR